MEAIIIHLGVTPNQLEFPLQSLRLASLLKITTGAIVDATIVHAPASTKKRDPRCTRRGKASSGI
jgi:hypothetical protein